ncbi:MAG: glycosyltransferase [Desulfovibrio sp.]|jgi:glycosyltransferase involved in cell wall biosynthesis|nr:glycosyltransferase [Desulfovibrio sp.]
MSVKRETRKKKKAVRAVETNSSARAHEKSGCTEGPRPAPIAGPMPPDISGVNGSGLKLLFIHQNFPAQYFHITRHYAADPTNLVVAVGEAANMRRNPPVPGVLRHGYDLPPSAGKSNAHTHHYVRGYEAKAQRGQAAALLLNQLRDAGFTPDVICVHPAWGEGLFIRSVWPDAPILAYAEWYGDLNDALWTFDPEFPVTMDMRRTAQAAHAAEAVSCADATLLQTPTRFQREHLPPAFRERCVILYDGIHTGEFLPDPEATLVLEPDEKNYSAENPPLPDWFPRRQAELTLTRADTAVTFINRVLEPFRGWHSFARAIPLIQAARPEAHFIIAGRARGAGAYGPPPPSGNWRDIYLNEIRSRIDPSRLHFTGTVPLDTVLRILTLSRAHVYLTYPFVLSYSPVEAMSCAAPLVLSDVEATREVAVQGESALFTDFHSPEAIAKAVIGLLGDPERAARMGRTARAHVIGHYDLESVWLPKWKRVIEALARREHLDIKSV